MAVAQIARPATSAKLVGVICPWLSRSDFPVSAGRILTSYTPEETCDDQS